MNYDGIVLDDDLYQYSISNGDTFSVISGVVHYSYGEYILYPRGSSDMVTMEDSDQAQSGSAASIYDVQSGAIQIGTGSDTWQRITL